MRSNKLRGCLAVAALFIGTSSASAQSNTDTETDDKTDDKAAPVMVAQATPEPTPPPEGTEPTEPSPTTPGAREPAPLPDEQLRKMIEEQVAKSRPKGPSLEFSGYARAGVGLALRGGKQVCFGLNGADTHWRLGNECDYVIEPQFTARLVNQENGASWGFVVMPGLFRTWEDPNGADSSSDASWFSNIPTEFRQVYFFGENMPELAKGRVWAGRRYYDRLHIGINDQFLEIHDSDGGGIEDMQVGPGKLSLAFLMNPNSEADRVADPAMPGVTVGTANLAPFKINARYTDIKTMPEGNLQIWAGFHGSANSDDESGRNLAINGPDNLFRVGIYHTIGKILGGINFLGAKVEIGPNHLLLRGVVKEEMSFNNGHTAVDVIAEFRSTRDRPDENTDYTTNNWFSLGARIDHQLKGPFRFLFEPGIDVVSPDGGDALTLLKVTPCLAISAGDGAGSRPTVRLFYTHGFWNDAARQGPLGVYQFFWSGTRLAQVYGDANNGGSFGIQAEAWW